MNSPLRFVIFSLIGVFILIGCNGGLNPSESVVNAPVQPGDTTARRAGISGIVSFRGKLPPADSLLELRVVAFFRKYPLDSIFNAVLGGEAFFSDTLPLAADTASYLIEKNLLTNQPVIPHRYDYIAVAQRYGTNYYSDWRAVGIYTLTGKDSLPSSVTVAQDSVVKDVNITVDYDHLPPQ